LVGTNLYMSPELMNAIEIIDSDPKYLEEEFKPKYNAVKSDVFSLGLVFL
jgi:hypothetical protein